MPELWQRASVTLREQLGEGVFDAHFRSSRLESQETGAHRLVLESELAALLVEKNYSGLVLAHLRAAGGVIAELRIDHAPQGRARGVGAAFPDGRSLRAAEPPPVAALDLRRSPSAVDLRWPDPEGEPVQLDLFGPPALRGLPSADERNEAGGVVDPRRAATAIMDARLAPASRLDSFVVGSGNGFAWEAARAVVAHPGALYNPLFLYGGVGLGKTHLLNGIGVALLERDPTRRVRYVSAETLMNELIDIFRSHQPTDAFRAKYRDGVDLLLVDDIQFLERAESVQSEFFHTFNVLHHAGAQIVVTSDRLPDEIPRLEDRLRSRLTMGLVADLQPPDLETRIAILERKATELRLDVPRAVLCHVAEYVQTNVRELHGALVRIGAWARHRRLPVTLDLAREQLPRVLNEPLGRPSPETVLRIVCDQLGVQALDLKGRKRAAPISRCRKIAMYLVRSHCGLSFPELGRFFGGRDHTTVLSGCESIGHEIASDAGLRVRISVIEAKIRAA